MSNLAESYIDKSFSLDNSVGSLFGTEELIQRQPSIAKTLLDQPTDGLVSDSAAIALNEEKGVSAALQPFVATRVTESLENEFYCIIDSVDSETEQVKASVYDINDRVQVLDITANFSEFLSSERAMIRPNANFYWRIGSRQVLRKRADKSDYKQSVVFSEFRMKLSYVSRRTLNGRLDSKVKKHLKLFV